MSDQSDYKALYEKLEKENQKLNKKNKNYVKIIKSKQDKNKELEKQIEFYKNGFAELCEEYEGDGEWSFAEVKFWIDKQNEENESLTEQLKATRFMRKLAEDNGQARRKEITQLKEENEILKRNNKQLLKEKEEKEEEEDEEKEEVNTKNIKGNRKIVQTTYYPVSAEFKIPDGIDLEDKSVVEYWAVKYGTLRIKYVGKEKEENIEWEYEPETDFKWGKDEIIDAEEANIEYEEDDTDTESSEEEERQVIIGIECNKCKQVPYPLGHRETWCLYRYTDCSFCGEKKSLDFKWGKEGDEEDEE